ncbi:MAG: peptidoglycan-binding protein LysM, partial [Deltaproteobacteria bacterium]|nr:peptidoglycan-binding protein LysM [Deltaproteobacteria bacterium]
MGLFSFAKTAGRKIGLFGGKAAEAQAAQETKDQLEQRYRMVAAELKKAVEGYGLDIAEFAVSFAAGTALLNGKAHTQSDKEKAVLVVGNTEGVAQVDDQLEVEVVEPPAIFHTVAEGDTLSEIAGANYGVMRLFPVVFEANKPMLEHPDQIYPGQVLRIPRVDPPVHTV